MALEGQVLETAEIVEGDIRMKRAIFRKIVKLFKVEKFNQSCKLNGVTFIEDLKIRFATA